MDRAQHCILHNWFFGYIKGKGILLSMYLRTFIQAIDIKTVLKTMMISLLKKQEQDKTNIDVKLLTTLWSQVCAKIAHFQVTFV